MVAAEPLRLEGMDADDLGERARECILDLITGVQQGAIEIRNGKEAAELIKVLHGVGQLERGRPTDLTGTVALDRVDIERGIEALHASIGQRQAGMAETPELLEVVE